VESAPRALTVEDTNVPEPSRVGDEDAAAAAAAQTASGNVEPVVVLLSSSEEYRSSRDLDPAAAASATNKIAEFVSASVEILGTEVYEELVD